MYNGQVLDEEVFSEKDSWYIFGILYTTHTTHITVQNNNKKISLDIKFSKYITWYISN